jgi:hypothetical protein
MSPPEDAFVLEQILRRPHRRLRWVFMELMPLRGQFDPMLLGTERMEYWHDVRRMWLLTRRAEEEFMGLWPEHATHPQIWRDLCARLITDWWKHLQSFATGALNYGRGAALLSRYFHDKKKSSRDDEAGPAGDGWVVPQEPQAIPAEQLATYERRLAAMRDNPPPHVGDQLNEESLRHTIDLLRRNGVKSILFLPPTLSHFQFYPVHTLESIPLFDLSDLPGNQDLYDVANRRDGVHLNLAGADLFTRKLATRFAEYVKASPR